MPRPRLIDSERPGKPVAFRIAQAQREALERFKERRGIRTDSEALRAILRELEGRATSAAAGEPKEQRGTPT